MKTWIRWLMIGALGLGLWACNLADPKSDTLTLRLADSLKASSKKYDKIRIERILVKAEDTVFRQVIFEGPYENPDQLKNIALEGPSSKTFILVLHGYRNDAEVLEIRLKFVDGRPGTPEVIKLIPISPAPGKPLVKGRTPVNIMTPTWTWASGGGGGIGEYRISVDRPDMAGAMLTQELTYTTPADVNEGTHTLYVQEKDAAGNWSTSGEWAIRIDVTPPDPPKVSASSPKTTNLKPNWTWQSGGNGGSGNYRYRLDDTAMVSGTLSSDITFTPNAALSEESHTLYVQEKDSAGNWSPKGLATLRIHGQTGYAVGGDGTIIKTKDGGASWNTLNGGTASSLTSTFFTARDTGYAVGEGGTIIKTTDGGFFWRPLKSGTEQTLRSICFVDYAHGFAVGDSGTILKTADAGASWQPFVSGFTKYLYAIHFADRDNGYIVGASDLVLKTTNGGRFWYSIPSITDLAPSFNSLHFTDADTGFAVGDGSAIFRTTDGGITWLQLTDFMMQHLFSITFTDAGNGYAVGDWGILFKSTDGGSTWKKEQINTTRDLHTIFFTDHKTGYTAGGDVLFKTIDGGDSWNALNSNTAKGLSSIYFP